MEPPAFAGWLRAKLAEREWTQQQLAEALGHGTVRSVSRWVNGKGMPRGASLFAVYAVFGEEPPAEGDPRISAADQLAALRDEVRRLGDRLEAASEARARQMDEVVRGQADIVEAVRKALGAIASVSASEHRQQEPGRP